MKNLDNYINEKLIVGKNIIHKNNNHQFKNKYGHVISGEILKFNKAIELFDMPQEWKSDIPTEFFKPFDNVLYFKSIHQCESKFTTQLMMLENSKIMWQQNNEQDTKQYLYIMSTKYRNVECIILFLEDFNLEKYPIIIKEL